MRLTAVYNPEVVNNFVLKKCMYTSMQTSFMLFNARLGNVFEK